MAKKRTFKEFKQGLYKPMNPSKCLNKTPPEFRSGLERKLMLVLDRNPNVVQWSSEKVVIPYQHPIKSAERGVPTLARYFVDFYVKLVVGESVRELLIEVKPEKQCSAPTAHGNKKPSTILYENTMWAINKAKWEAAKKYCEKKKYTFVIITENNIETILSS